MPASTIRVTQGAPKFWTRLANSGRRIRCAFCPDCGSRLWHEAVDSDYLSIKAGSLDEPVDTLESHPHLDFAQAARDDHSAGRGAISRGAAGIGWSALAPRPKTGL